MGVDVLLKIKYSTIAVFWLSTGPDANQRYILLI